MNSKCMKYLIFIIRRTHCVVWILLSVFFMLNMCFVIFSKELLMKFTRRSLCNKDGNLPVY
jgi:hypothetical protein